MPKVSIVIPAFNAGRFISETLQSVIAQTLTDWEVIIVDNASTDNTVQIAASFADRRIRIVSFHNHGVIAASRNEGARLATGQWIAFLDADDRWHPKKLARCLEVMDSKADLLAHGLQYFGEGRTSWSVSPPALNPLHLRRLLFSWRNPIGTSGTIVRRSAFVAVGGFCTTPELVTVEDWDLWLRLAAAGSFIQCVPDVLGDYRLHQTSTGVSSGPDKQLRAGLTALDQHFQALPKKTFIDYALKRRKQSTFYYTGGRKLHDSGDFRAATSYYLTALSHNLFSVYIWGALILLRLGIAPRTQRKQPKCIS